MITCECKNPLIFSPLVKKSLNITNDTDDLPINHKKYRYINKKKENTKVHSVIQKGSRNTKNIYIPYFAYLFLLFGSYRSNLSMGMMLQPRSPLPDHGRGVRDKVTLCSSLWTMTWWKTEQFSKSSN